MTTDKEYKTYEDIEYNCLLIANYYKEYNIDCVIGVSRGGVIPATMISYMMGVPMLSLHCSLRDNNDEDVYQSDLKTIQDSKYKNLLIIDDLVDSGETVIKLRKDFSLYDKQFDIASLYYKKESKHLVDFSPSEVTKWVVFTWDQLEKVR